ncbi:hypothetical protein [Candidatus Nitrospira allomarina]|jgi:hypothetical protein|uniref:Uncharacterized protein n=1 Tax=Candidatus Nitrospira allomarina TaxID=3020900 RepID=A0AA96GF44_9BACT|nr:hypothetical protein [Candidatus Nitrospira allomarina]WNM57544.1 hypothetical protein PP769_16465 [Candidatus Nitrospira allomarina]
MSKRSTIGTNPLDEIIPNPLGAAIPDQHKGSDPSVPEDVGKPENRNRPAGQQPMRGRDHHDKKVGTRLYAVLQDDRPQGKTKSFQEGPVSAAPLNVEVLPATGQLSERLVELEEENLCLKWALGVILAPLVLLALLG